MMTPALLALQDRLGYKFRDPALIVRALTHPSFRPDPAAAADHNQRLEFLGDAILQLVLTEALFQLYPDEREGDLSRRRATLAKGSVLAKLALELELDACLLVGVSESRTGGEQRASNLSDAFEAVFGAVYLDSDWVTVRRVLLGVYGDVRARLVGLVNQHNPKGQLQEIVQPLHGNKAVRYELLRTEGNDHERLYHVEVFFLNRALGQGSGSSKKLAEEAAARIALVSLKTKPLT